MSALPVVPIALCGCTRWWSRALPALSRVLTLLPGSASSAPVCRADPHNFLCHLTRRGCLHQWAGRLLLAFARCRSVLLGPRATSTRACWKPRLAEDVVLGRAQAQKGARVQLRFSCLALSSALPPCSAAGAAAVNREERTRNELSACSILGYAELCPLFASRLVGVPVAGARVCQPGLASPRSCQALPAVLPCVGSLQTTTGAIGDCSWLLLAVAGSRGLHRRGHV